MARSRLAIALVLAFACTAWTGGALAGKPDDPGKSEEAPGQVKKSEQAPQPATASQGKSGTKGKSATAPGKTKTGKAATGKGKSADVRTTGKPVSPGKSGSAPGKTKTEQGPTVAQRGDGQIKTAHEKVLICHSTGSASNPWVVINVSVNALKSGHDQLGTRAAVMAPGAREAGRRTADVHGGRFDIILGNPATIGNVSKAELEARCAALAPPEEEALGQAQPTVTTTAAPTEERSEVAGALARAPAPKAKAKPRGGVLGAIGAVGAAELPFTGLPLWIAALIGVGLAGAGFGARRAMR